MKPFLSFISMFYLLSCSSKDATVYSGPGQDEFQSGCQVKLLRFGKEALLHRVKLIRSAQKSIDLQTFIWTDDECGRLLLHELYKAAGRGVQVQIICDHLFSHQNPKALAAISKIANFEVKVYNPAGDSIKPNTLSLMLATIGDFHKVNQRMHNKLLLIDAKVAICGGRNIENTYYDSALGLNFKDLDVAVKGPVCASMKVAFEKFWNSPISVPVASLKDVAEHINTEASLSLEIEKNSIFQAIEKSLKSDAVDAGYMNVEKMAFFSDEPGKNDRRSFSGSSQLNDFITHTIKEAKQRIWIQSPYLVLSEKAEKTFTEIRQANEALEIKISTNSLVATDSWPTYAFFYRQKKMLIEDLKVEIYEMKPLPVDLMDILSDYSKLLEKMTGQKSLSEEERQTGDVVKFPRLCLHSKCMLVDDEISFVGSYNMDPRSANLNTELSVVIIDKEFNRMLAGHIAKDISAGNSWVVAKRQKPIGVKQLNYLFSIVNGLGVKLTGIDLWPRRYTSCFELNEGAKEVSAQHEDFYNNYHAVGNFPRMPMLTTKEILTRFFKVFGVVLKPVL